MGTSLNFDATQVSPTPDRSPLPNDTYRAHIVGSEIKPTKKNDGKYLQLTWEVLEGDYKGRRFWENLNIQNKNVQAQEISQRALSAICHATGVLHLTNSQQLHNKPVMVKLVVKQSPGYDPSNEVKGHTACEGMGVALPKSGTTAHGGEAAGSIAPAPAPAANAPAWSVKKSA